MILENPTGRHYDMQDFLRGEAAIEPDAPATGPVTKET
jgi:chlorophyllide a reductase subunit X